MDNPNHHAEANEDASHSNCKISVAPGVRESNIIELPQPKQQECHEAEPNTLVNNPKSYPVLVDALCESPQFPEPIQLTILQQCNTKSPCDIKSNDEEVVASGDEECSIHNSDFELLGSGR